MLVIWSFHVTIFNFLGEGFHWLLVSFLYWVLCHYLDNFIAVFTAKVTKDQICYEKLAYS